MSPRTARVTGFAWHSLLPIRDLIDQKTAVVDSDYVLVFGDAPDTRGGRTIETGYTDFTRRQCWVNASFLKNATTSEQFAMTVFIAAHERAHARWTDFVAEDFQARNSDGSVVINKRTGVPVTDVMVQQVWNVLEDERIERLLGRDFPHLHAYLRRGNQLLLQEVPACTGTDDPGDVINWILRRRLSERSRRPEPCPLSASNQECLADIEPLLEEAFSCQSSRRVVEIAREIVERLKLNTVLRLYTLLSGQEGAREHGDKPEQSGATADESALYDDDVRKLGEEIDRAMEGVGYTDTVDRRQNLNPGPYEELLAEIQPSVAAVRQLFAMPPVKRIPLYESSGTRLSLRAVHRTPKTPFRVDGPVQRRGAVALTMVIDDSGSMGGVNEAQAKRTALLCYEALSHPHQARAVLAPSGTVIADRSLREMSRAYIAGYSSDNGTEYCTVLRREVGLLEQQHQFPVRYLVLIADGESSESDAKACQEILHRARKRRIHAFGVGLGLSNSSKPFFERLFGDHFIDLQDPEKLPMRMQALLRRMAPHRRPMGVA